MVPCPAEARPGRRSLPRWLAWALALPAGLAGQAPPAGAQVILHAFDWSYAEVARQAEVIARAGYGAVLVAPPLKSPRRRPCPWYLRYQPQDWRVIDNCGGNRESLVAAIAALRARGVQTYADVVVNHMANERQQDLRFPGEAALADYGRRRSYWRRQILYGDTDGNGVLDNGLLPDDGRPDGLFGPQDFHPARCIRAYGDRESVHRDRLCHPGGSIPGLPDLIDRGPGGYWVTQQRRRYIQALFDLGIRGFRIDAAKHMPIETIRAFVPERVWRRSPIIAEIITGGGVGDGEYHQFLEPYLRALPPAFGAYDFPLLHLLRRALAPDGSLADVAWPLARGQALEGRRALTVVVTHDIPTNAGFRSWILWRGPGSTSDEDLAYAYILGRDGGTPMVLADGSRPAADGGRWVSGWRSPAMVAMIRFHNRLQGQAMEVLAASACALVWRRGDEGIVAINKCTQAMELGVASRIRWRRSYRDVLSGHRLAPTPGLDAADQWRLQLRLPGRTARLWLAE